MTTIDPRVPVDHLPGFHALTVHPRSRPEHEPREPRPTKADTCSICGEAIEIPVPHAGGRYDLCNPCKRPLDRAIQHGESQTGIRAKLRARRAAENS